MAKIITAWRCDNCGNENPGRTADGKKQIIKCLGCGASIPAQPHFYVPEQPIEITDSEVLAALAKNGAAWVCGYCGSYNEASPEAKAEVVECNSCHSKFRQSEIGEHYYRTGDEPHSAEEAATNLEAFSTAEEALANLGQKQRPRRADNYRTETAAFADHTYDAPSVVEPTFTQPAEDSHKPLFPDFPLSKNAYKKRVFSFPPKENKVDLDDRPVSTSKWLWLGGIIAFLLACWGIFVLLNQKPVTGQVVGFAWQSQVQLWHYEEVNHSDWQRNLPAAAHNRDCYDKETGSYEQKPEQCIKGYNSKTVDRPCTETVPVSCTKINSDGTADTGAICYETRSTTCSETVTDYNDPIYGICYVDDHSRPIYDTYCDYQMTEPVVTRTLQNAGENRQPQPPVYTLLGDEQAYTPTYQYLVDFHWQNLDKEKTEQTKRIAIPFEQWQTSELETLYVGDFLFGQLQGYHVPTEKELTKIEEMQR